MFTQALAREKSEPGSRFNQRQPGPDRNGIESRLAIGRTAEGRTRTSTAMDTSMKSPRWWRSSQARKQLTSPAANLTVDGGMNA